MKTAVASDFKVGATFQDKEEGWRFTITSKYSDGIWNARTNGGDKCVFESEAQCNWLVKAGN